MLKQFNQSTSDPLPEWLTSPQFHDLVSLALHRAVAHRLRSNPRLLQKAKSNLKIWLGKSQAISAWLEWQEILETSSIEKVLKIITAETEEGQRLRSSSPFVGLLTAEERRQIIKECEKARPV